MSEREELLERARASLEDAREVQDVSDRLFWNALYYAEFYGAKAALLTVGVDATTHSGTDRMVGKELYREHGVLEAEQASFYSDLRRIREEMDYQPNAEITRDKEETLQQVETLIDRFAEVVEESS